MNTDNITGNGQAEGEVIVDAPAAPESTVSSEAEAIVSLKEINDYLGKNYKDKSSALKSLKDTFSFVGKKIEKSADVETSDVRPSSKSPDFAQELKRMGEELFYTKNPQYESMRTLISKLGENPADVVNTPEFKTIFDKTSSFDKIQKQKTVLESNPRIGTVRNKLQEATDASGKRDYSKAADLATQAVLEAYEM